MYVEITKFSKQKFYYIKMYAWIVAQQLRLFQRVFKVFGGLCNRRGGGEGG